MEFWQCTEKEFRIMLRKMTVDKKEFTAFLKLCLELIPLTSKYILVHIFRVLRDLLLSKCWSIAMFINEKHDSVLTEQIYLQLLTYLNNLEFF